MGLDLIALVKWSTETERLPYEQLHFERREERLRYCNIQCPSIVTLCVTGSSIGHLTQAPTPSSGLTASAVESHVGHGDTVGPCVGD